MSRVFIGRLSYDTRESDVERFLRGYGRIREISLKKGYGFIEFDDSRDAEDAVEELDGRELLGESVSVQFARGRKRDSGFGGGRYGSRSGFGGGRGGGGGGSRGGSGRYGPPLRTQYRVVVENVSSRTSWQDLKDYLRQAGKVTYADLHKQRVGEGVVEFASYEDMKNVIKKLDDTDLNGRKIRIFEERARSHSPKRRSRSRSRSRSHSRSLSRSPRRRSRSKSFSRSRSRSRSPAKERANSDKSKSRSRTPSPRKSRSRSKTPVKERSQSPEPENLSN